MKFLTFKTLLENNLHISRKDKSLRDEAFVYKNLKREFIIDLTYTSVSLYRLYKFFYTLGLKNLYVTFIHFGKMYNRKYVKLVHKYTSHNFFMHKWVSGVVSNPSFLRSAFILVLWVNKLKTFSKKHYLPRKFFKIYSKFKFMSFDLKFLKFSKFLFFFNLEGSEKAIRECLVNSKFLMGFCSPSYDVGCIDFYIYGNNTNEVAFNFVLRFILFSCVSC